MVASHVSALLRECVDIHVRENLYAGSFMSQEYLVSLRLGGVYNALPGL
jgi:hypothetical protein